MSDALHAALTQFAQEKRFRGKGPLALALVVTQHARKLGLPLDPEALKTDGGGQVLGLGRGAVQAILARHDITRVLAAEGGRTSRGSLGRMLDYVQFLNSLPAPDLDAVEAFWIARVREFFAGKPFKLRMDPAQSLRAWVAGLLEQARARQKESGGTHYLGAVLQHLTGAIIASHLPDPESLHHHSFSTSDAQSGRAGDFLIGGIAIHVTTTPSEAVMARCRENCDAGLRPLLITLPEKLALAEGLADNAALRQRLDIWDIEQFCAICVTLLSGFNAASAAASVTQIASRYNAIIDAVETDPSLKIDVA
ncbi:DUF4928 family protein [Magnetofaba australis]|uniref:DUF4928 domain-containing protein n=1 Tax=Magnetofaba australis IT-1 TaxID=1434232 RepID=A0A1Y2K8I0_9PROT|nr:DUF4928 family protein [Magnetofaba australis]OSM06807.1 hypothetical protein MAIT1_00326 [Magnetofaba australis IT-1]